MMAPNTPANLQNLVIYEIFTRNHTAEGNFAGVEADLERIQSLGVDVIWLMPIHPIGKVARKGSLGSPYSIADYRGINPEYGTEADFTHLIHRAHELGLKVMIDVVYNHTAHDSDLVDQHSEWYHLGEDSRPISTVPEWSDVIDLVHPNLDLDNYLYECLQGWARLGVDGFRCDVASIVPLEFWLRARQRVAEVNPDVIWLAESVHAAFIENRRKAGLSAESDAQLYEAFDITYDYDIWPIWYKALVGKVPVDRYLEMLRFQGTIYPTNYIKLHYVENHDTPRIMESAPTLDQALAWTAFEIFNKGAFLIYAGQEAGANHRPSLFDKDLIKWGEYKLQDWFKSLLALKRNSIITHGYFSLLESDPVIQASWNSQDGGLYGIFNISGSGGDVQVRLPDGFYEELATGMLVKVKDGRITLPRDAAILRYSNEIDLSLVYSPLMDD